MKLADGASTAIYGVHNEVMPFHALQKGFGTRRLSGQRVPCIDVFVPCRLHVSPFTSQ